MTSITSTELKQNTRKVLQQIELKPGEPILVYTYNQPKVVIMSYNAWKKGKEEISNKRPSIKDLEKFFIKTKAPINSSTLIRKMRDEE